MHNGIQRLWDWGRFHAFVKGAGHKTQDDISPTLQSLRCSLLCSQMLCKPPSMPVRNALQEKKTLPQTTPVVFPLSRTLLLALENEPKSSTVLVQSK